MLEIYELLILALKGLHSHQKIIKNSFDFLRNHLFWPNSK